MSEAALVSSRWHALLRLECRRGADSTRLVPLERHGPLSVQRPFYPEGDCCHVYLLHPPGGVVGGDQLELQVNLKPGAHSLLTAPGAAKFYLSAGDSALVDQRFHVAADACLEYLPPENIYFPGALVDARTSLDLEPGARALLWEKQCFGRPANREGFDTGGLRSRLEVKRQGRPLLFETQRVDADHLRAASGYRGHPVAGTLVACGVEWHDELVASLQALKPEQGLSGVTRPGPDLLVSRYLGPSTSDLNHYFIQLWERLRPILFQRTACHPRIWNT